MEFFVSCLIDISDFVLIGISFVSILMTFYKRIMRVKGHQVKFQNHHLSAITNLGRRFGTSKMHISPRWPRLLSVLRRWFCCCCLFVYCYFHCGSL